MKRNPLKRIGLAIIAGLLSLVPATGRSQAVIWEHQVAVAPNAKLARDTTGHLYFVTANALFTGRQLRIQKFNPLGGISWTREITVSGPASLQYRIQKIAVNATHVFVAVHVRGAYGSGPFVSSQLEMVRQSDGGTEQSYNTALEIGAVGVNNSTIAISQRNVSTNASNVTFLSPNDFNSRVEVPVANSTSVGDVVVDSSGAAYASFVGGNSADTALLVRATTSGLTFSAAPPSLGITGTAHKVVVDPTVGRVYGIFNFDSVMWSRSVMIAAASSVDGSSAAITFLTIYGMFPETTGDLTVIPGQGVIASCFTPTDQSADFIRFAPNLEVDWLAYLFNTPWQAAYGDSIQNHALTPDGHLGVFAMTSDGRGRIIKLNLANGGEVSSLTFPFGLNFNPRELVIDAAGNYFVNANTDGGSRLARVQPARLNLSANNVTGGATVHGSIVTPENAPANQVWTLASSNSALVSVPASVELPAGSSAVTFPLTINSSSTTTNVTVNARHGGFIVQRAITLLPANIRSMTIMPQVVIGGGSTTAILNLTGTAPAGGQMVSLFSSKPAVASVPATAIVPAGQSTYGVMVTTFGVNSNQGVVITASTGAVSKTAFFAVNAPSLMSISVFPATIQGGQTGTLTLNINGIAPTGGFSIVLFSGAPSIVFLTASASITAGEVTRNVDVPTAPVTTSLPVTIFATRSGIYRTTTLTVTP